LSLDDYSGLVQKEPGKKQVAVKGGTRVRDVVKLLLKEGLAFRALPSHDAQSIAGILSTDVHGTGNVHGTENEWGFVSQSVVRLKLIDGKGEVHVCEPTDDLFKAAIGGVGAVGIITEVVVQGVERFTVEQRVQTANLSFVKQNLERLIENNEHLSLYLFPFTSSAISGNLQGLPPMLWPPRGLETSSPTPAYCPCPLFRPSCTALSVVLI
jgi:FAD/FMN-containing dehydrogenase